MFHKLHIRFTFFFASIASLILIFMSIICLLISEKGMKQNHYIAFLNNMNAAIIHIESQNVLTYQWFLETEQNARLFIRIKDNNRELFYQRQNTSLQDLFEKTAQTARDTYGLDIDSEGTSSIMQKTDFQIKDDEGTSYYACAARIPKDHGFLSVVALEPMTGLKQQILVQRIGFVGADLLGIFLLTVFSWFFTKKLLSPIEKNRRQQAAFISSASHELRSPLTVILSDLSALKKADNKEKQQAFLSSIEQEGLRMSRLIEDMLALANADSHSWSIHLEETEIDTLLLDTYEKYEPLMREKKLHFSIRLPDEILPPCSMDSVRILQVLSILLDNALSYVPAGGHVQIGLIYQAPAYLISVSDDGPGISAEHREHVFRRFYRGDSSRHEKSHFGLGLSIASEIMKLHKGEITLTDSPEGGACFLLKLNSRYE